MLTTNNLVSSDLLKLPVVLTPRAWQEAVHIENPQDVSVISNRLGDVVLEAYRELHMQPDCTQIHFGLYRLLPAGDNSDRVWRVSSIRGAQAHLPTPNEPFDIP